MARTPRHGKTSPHRGSARQDQERQVAHLRDRIKSDPPKSLRSYWQLGRDTRQITGLSSRELAAAIEIGDTTLRLAMKFSKRANARLAAQLERAGVHWQSITRWLGRNDPEESKQLLDRMLSGLTNSTQIRAFIKEHFHKPANPRRWQKNYLRTYQKAQAVTEGLIASLKTLAAVHQQVTTDPVKARQAKSQVRELRAALRQADMEIRTAQRLLGA